MVLKGGFAMGRLQRDTEPARPCETFESLIKLLARHANFRVLVALGAGELNVSALAWALGKGTSIVSRSLGDLMRHGVVLVRQEGNARYYRLSSRAAVVSVDSTVRLATRARDGSLIRVRTAFTTH